MTRLPLSRVVEIAGMVDSPVATRRLPNPVNVDELTALAREVVALREAERATEFDAALGAAYYRMHRDGSRESVVAFQNALIDRHVIGGDSGAEPPRGVLRAPDGEGAKE